MEAVPGLLAAVFLLLGSAFAVVGGIGLLRLPDFFTRIHAAGITDTMGAGLILTGLMLEAGVSLIAAKLALILAFLWISGPTATHALAKSAIESGLEPHEREHRDGEEPESSP